MDAFALTPANEDVAKVSLRLVERLLTRRPIKVLIGDRAYTNPTADRWAVPLARMGVEQCLFMREDNHSEVGVRGALMQHAWLICPAAPVDQRPLPVIQATPAWWEEHFELTEAFQRMWAFERKESGLKTNLTTKWICPARAGRVGCLALGTPHIEAARRLGLPIITPPQDWQSRDCCKQSTIDFTPDPSDPAQQRKLAQREFYGSRRWRAVFKRRGMVEGAFGILKNPSRLRMRRGQNRVAGLAIASLIAAVKIALFNEEQLRSWHERTGLGPADHPLLKPDAPYYGFVDATKEQANEIVARYFTSDEPDDSAGGLRMVA